MTEAELKRLTALFAEREKVLDMLKKLHALKPDPIAAMFRDDTGGYTSFVVSKHYVDAQLTTKRCEIERRIRAAGGTI